MSKEIIKIVFWCLTFLMLTACIDKQVPPKARSFIDQYFPGTSVILVEKELEDGVLHLNVWLSDGTRAEFDLQGNWERVARKKTGVPQKLILPAIMTYVKKNYPGDVPTKFSKKPYGYKVELSDDMDLRFTHSGHFIEEID